MPDTAVVNASPLIFLSRAGLIDLLKQAGSTIVVPSPVAEEIKRRGVNDPTAQALVNNEWLVIFDVPSIPPVIQSWDLGAGESSVLTHAYNNAGMIAIIDDLCARRCAVTFNIPVIGTLGLVLIAKKRGVIPLARPVMDKLRQTGMYLSNAIMNQALALVGE